VWIPGFGWIEDEGGGNVGIIVDGEGDINKQVGVMCGGTTVGNPGDELTGNKVGIMGGYDKPLPNTDLLREQRNTSMASTMFGCLDLDGSGMKAVGASAPSPGTYTRTDIR